MSGAQEDVCIWDYQQGGKNSHLKAKKLIDEIRYWFTQSNGETVHDYAMLERRQINASNRDLSYSPTQSKLAMIMSLPAQEAATFKIILLQQFRSENICSNNSTYNSDIERKLVSIHSYYCLDTEQHIYTYPIIIHCGVC
ncbi:uncharacterized protein [Medicago truncatula]|uniref:uncharacterized protein n=1 Tax=Medicago truncatula TaxID=3880 RepID=UPI000D2F1F91|nr:uncharacterized protein LOC112417045 [Medicago truncatula]